MRLFIGEFLCGGGLSTSRIDEIPQSLLREGNAMLKAVVADATELPGVKVVVPVDPRLVDPRGMESAELHDLESSVAWSEAWQDWAADCDAVVAIAPEDGPLGEVYGMLADAGPLWIGCRNEALDAGISKRTLAELLFQSGIPTPPTLTAEEVSAGLTVPSSNGWVTKPVDGCGSVGIRILQQWQEVVNDLRTKSKSYRIVQPRLRGRAASCSILCGSAGYLALPPMWQQLDPSNFQYLGGSGPIEEPLAERAKKIALQAVKALGEGACGYVGVDLLLGDAVDGSEDAVIEVNPRITTSYVGLRHIVSGNLLAMMLELARGKNVSYSMNARQLKFDNNGLVCDVKHAAT